MSRSEEVLLLFFTGVLLAFGISEHKRHRRPRNFSEEMEQSGREMASYWKQIGSFVRDAKQCDEQQKAGYPRPAA